MADRNGFAGNEFPLDRTLRSPVRTHAEEHNGADGRVWNQYLTGPISRPARPRNLRYQLERTLSGTKVRKGEPRINTHHTHERHVREIMALR